MDFEIVASTLKQTYYQLNYIVYDKINCNCYSMVSIEFLEDLKIYTMHNLSNTIET